MTTPLADASGFSEHLRGNPPGYVPNAVPRRRSECPLMNDASRGHIAIHNATAVAAVHSLAQLLRLDRPAIGTGLGRAARVDQLHFGTGTCSLVRRELDECAPRSVVNRPGKHPPLEPGHIEVFEGDALVARDQRQRDLVQVILSLAGDLGRAGRKPRLHLKTPTAPPAASGQSTLSPALSLLRFTREGRHLNRLSVARGNEVVKAEINPHRACARGRDEVRLNREDDKPPALLPGQDRSPELCVRRKITMPNSLDPARNTQDADAAILFETEAVSDAESRRVVARRGTEARKAVPALEKRRDALVNPPQHLLQSREGPPSDTVRIGGTACFEFCCPMSVAQCNLAAAIGFVALLKAGIVQAAEVSQHFVKDGCLRLGWPKSIFVGSHAHELSISQSPTHRIINPLAVFGAGAIRHG